MSRKTYVLRGGELVEKQHALPVNAGPHVISDIEPFVATATRKDTIIGSRSHKREYMRRNNLVEFGNDLKPTDFNIRKG